MRAAAFGLLAKLDKTLLKLRGSGAAAAALRDFRRLFAPFDSIATESVGPLLTYKPAQCHCAKRSVRRERRPARGERHMSPVRILASVALVAALSVSTLATTAAYAGNGKGNGSA